MTKVMKQMVTCSKCNKESEQVVVYSVNFSLGKKEDNIKLMNAQQKCPYCNYEDHDISVKKDN